MQDHLRTRLEELKKEYQKGQERLSALEQETNTVKNSMLRISGAIQVLEEMLQLDLPEHPENNTLIDEIKPSESG